MDFLSPCVSCLLVFVSLYVLWRKSHTFAESKVSQPPEIPGAWPLIGHLHLLGGQYPLAKTFAAFADKHGPIFTLRLGLYRAVVVSDRKAIQECFTTHDKVLATRPTSSAGKYLGYNHAAFGITSYGPYWRKMRKLVLQEVLSTRRLEKFKEIRVSEVETCIKELYSTVSNNQLETTSGSNHNPGMVDIGHWLQQVTLNIIVKMIAGKRFRTDGLGDKEEKRYGKVTKQFMYLSGQFVMSDVVPIPLLKWLDLQGHIKSMKRISKEMDAIVSSWIEEHIQRRRSQKSDNNNNFIDVLFAVIDDELSYSHTRDVIIKATVLNLILAGSDTTSIHLTWVLSLLLNNKDALERAREEIDIKIDSQKWVEDCDIKNLVYLQAVVKEALRLYPSAPLLVPHEATDDCEVVGYRIPKGTRLLVNVWKLHRDPQVWSEPEKFKPERFLIGETAEVDYLGHHFEFLPFGSGRRSCPGITFAMQVTHLVIARLLQGFDFSTRSKVPADMTEGPGINLPKASPLEVQLVPRLPSVFYGASMGK